VPKAGVELKAEEVIEFIKKRLSRDKVPTKVFIAEEVPKTATGKIQRRFVAAKFLQL